MRMIISCLATAAACLALVGLVTAADNPKDDQKDERNLATAASSLDETGSQPDGQKAIASHLEEKFGVNQARIDGLRSQGLGYGEIAIVLALAQKMPGGITDATVQNIMTMRTGPPTVGWGEIARKLGEKLGPVVSEVSAVARESRQAIGKVDDAGNGARPEKAAKPDRPSPPDRPEKPDKPERPEKP